MPRILRTYDYSEFVSEFGIIKEINIDDKVMITENGTTVFISKPYYQGYINGLVALDEKSLKSKYFVLVLGYCGERDWYIVTRNFITDNISMDYAILFKNTSYTNIIRRRNFCRIIIPQYIEKQTIVLENQNILSFERLVDNNYKIETSKGTYYGSYDSTSFIGALSKVFQYDCTDNDKRQFEFVVYPDGSFCKRKKT